MNMVSLKEVGASQFHFVFPHKKMGFSSQENDFKLVLELPHENQSLNCSPYGLGDAPCPSPLGGSKTSLALVMLHPAFIGGWPRLHPMMMENEDDAIRSPVIGWRGQVRAQQDDLGRSCDLELMSDWMGKGTCAGLSSKGHDHNASLRLGAIGNTFLI